MLIHVITIFFIFFILSGSPRGHMSTEEHANLDSFEFGWVFIYIYTYIYIYISIHLYIYTSIHIYMCLYTANTCTHTYTHTCTYIHTYTYTHIHTHTSVKTRGGKSLVPIVEADYFFKNMAGGSSSSRNLYVIIIYVCI